jgi:hypothetical protein
VSKKRNLNTDLPHTGSDKYIFYAIGFIIIVIAALTSFFPIENYDIWWHLKTGEYIVSEKAIPDSDIYSFTAEGKSWITHEWLAELIFYAVYVAGGLNFLIVFKVLVSVLIAFLLLYHIRNSKYKNPLLYILVVAAICIGSFRLFVRPHLFTYLFLTIVSINIFNDRYFDRNRHITLLMIPAIFLLWANIHSGFVIGLGVYWIVAVGAVVQGRNRKTGRYFSFSDSLKKYIIPPAIASLAAFLNPNGIKAFTYPFLLASEPVFRDAIAEMVSPFEIFSTQKIYLLLLVIIIGFAVYGIFRNIRSRPAISVILLIGVISSLTSVRNSYEFALLTAVASIVTFPSFTRGLLWAGALSAFVFTVCCGYFSSKYIYDARGIGFGISADLPHSTADFLDKIEYRGNVYAPLGWGSYFIWRGWPDRRVFIDGRLLVYGPQFLNEYHFIRQNEPGALEMLESYGTEAVAVPIGQLRWPIRDAVAVSPDWQLCYFDDRSVVLLRKNDRNNEWLEEWGYSKINPLMPGYLNSEAQRADTALIVEEALRAYELSPGSVTTNAVLARAYYLNSDYVKAASYYKTAIMLEPRMTDFIYQVANSYHRGGELDSAAVWYEKSIAAMPTYEQSYFEYGAIEAARGRYEKAIEIWERVLRFNPDSQAKKFIEDVRRIMSSIEKDSSQGP